jgi:hypothetical protein
MAKGFEGKITDALTIIDVIDAQTIAFGETGVLTAAIDMSKYTKILAIISTGTLGTVGTLDGFIGASATSTGTYVALAAKSLTQFVKATGDNDIATIEVDRQQVALLGKGWCKLHLIAGTADAICSAVVLGLPANAGLASAFNTADVVQTL